MRMQDDNEGYTAGWDEDTIRRTDLRPEPDSGGDDDGGELFGSSPAGGFNAAFGDASTRTLPFEIDPAVFKSLGDIRDGRNVPGS